MATLDSATEQTLRDIIKDLTIEDLLRYHKDYEEPQIPQVRSSAEYPEDYDFFAAIVDGKVSATYVAHKEFMPELISAFSSDPKIIVLADNQKNVVQPNWTYDEQTGAFLQPS